MGYYDPPERDCDGRDDYEDEDPFLQYSENELSLFSTEPATRSRVERLDSDWLPGLWTYPRYVREWAA